MQSALKKLQRLCFQKEEPGELLGDRSVEAKCPEPALPNPAPEAVLAQTRAESPRAVTSVQRG